jgi:pyruvate/2-oxoglutarate dehydrogenase complex dihydrolipoamide dehydrogenase (E3) component
MVCIETSLFRNVPLRCAVNPACGLESEYRLMPANQPKKVIVVGGGPSGMEAAIIAARREHQVTLYEKETGLGGQLIVAAIPPNKDKIGPLTKYLITQVRKLGIKIELKKEVNRLMVEAAKPDIVILATGAENITPDIPGVDKANVAFAEDVLTGKVEVGIEVAIVGGNLVGCETADFLADRGVKVTIVEILDRLATKMNPFIARFLLDRLAKKGVTMLTGVKREEYKDHTLVITTNEGEEINIGVDTIVLAAGARPNNTLSQTLEGLDIEIHSVGDCVEPRNFTEAIAEAFNIGRMI